MAIGPGLCRDDDNVLLRLGLAPGRAGRAGAAHVMPLGVVGDEGGLDELAPEGRDLGQQSLAGAGRAGGNRCGVTRPGDLGHDGLLGSFLGGVID